MSAIQKNISLVPYNCGWGTHIHGSAKGPQVLKQFGLAEKLTQMGIAADWAEFLYTAIDASDESLFEGLEALPLVLDYSQKLFAQVQEVIRGGNFPVVLGGDHSMAMGTWSGVAEANQNHGNLGLIWIDAHKDAHTPETSPSKSFHGMPLATLLGHGEEQLCNLGSTSPVINPEHLCLLGIRSYEDEEEMLLKDLGVTIFMMEQIREEGFATCLNASLEKVAVTDGFGISLDLDAFDPEYVPGTGTPVEDGLHYEEVLDAIKGVGNHPDLQAIEIAEYNPELGKDGKTSTLILDILAAFFSSDS